MSEKPSKIRILLICSNKQTLMLKSIIEELGSEVHVSCSPGTALAIFEEYLSRGTPFHAVITDYIVNGMNGIDVVKKIHESAPGTILTLLPSAYLFDDEVRAECADFGKLIDIETTFEGIKNFLNIIKRRQAIYVR